MLKNIVVFQTDFSDSLLNRTPQVLLKKTDKAVLNTSFIKFVNVLKVKNTTVWKLNLVDDEILYVKPFKI